MAVKTPSRVDEIEKDLADRLNELADPDGRLPSEAALASTYGVSRTTIRSAVGALVARGLVIRRQGMGSFVSRGARIANPLGQLLDFCEMIERNGSQPGIRYLGATLLYPAPEVAKALQRVDELAIERRTVFTADGVPVIYCINTIPLWVLPGGLAREILSDPSVSEPIFSFFAQKCEQRVAYRTGTIRPDLGRNCHADALECDPVTPVLVIDEVAYNIERQPILHSAEYYPGNFMTFELVRRADGG